MNNGGSYYFCTNKANADLVCNPQSNHLIDYTNKFHRFKYTLNETGGKSFCCYTDNCIVTITKKMHNTR